MGDREVRQRLASPRARALLGGLVVRVLMRQILAIRPRRHFIGGAKWIRYECKRVVFGIRGDDLMLKELVDLAESRSLAELCLRALEPPMRQMPNG